MNQFSSRFLILVLLLGSGWLCGADAMAAGSRGMCESLFRASMQSSSSQASPELVPDDVIIRKMNPRRVVVSEVRPSYEWTESMVKIRSEMLALKQTWEKQQKSQMKVHDKVVLYPMSGFDLATPLILFPKAQTYVLIDNHSLMRPSDVSDFLKRRVQLDYVDRNASWIRYDRTGSDVFQKLMTALFAHAPKSEIVSIEFYVDTAENVSSKIVVRTKAKSSKTVEEKTIWYLVGEVGHVDREAKVDAESRRSYNSRIEDAPIQSNGPWWGALVDSLAPRTLILKGSMSGLRPSAFENPIPWRERLIAPILQEGGLIIEGSSRMDQYQDATWAKALDPKRTRWEFTDGDPRFKWPRDVVELENVEFSYARNVRIGFYDPQTESGNVAPKAPRKNSKQSRPQR